LRLLFFGLAGELDGEKRLKVGGKMSRLKFLGWFVLLTATLGQAQSVPSADTAIRLTMEEQVAAWNRGDIEAFMHAYEDSPETTFIGKSVEHGYQPILERYKKAYAGRDAMGKLDFSELVVRPLGEGYAVVTGRYHLARTSAGGGDARGTFSLVLEKTEAGWKIILDHTSAL
jgi:uncharacterized protein (TIGR02246 family)